DRGTAVFLEALGEASPALREPLFRLANLLAELTSGGDSLLDLGLCVTGEHLGGLQRALCRGFPSAVGRLVEGRDDRFLPALDRLAARVPEEGPVRPFLRGLFDKARRALMAECRDMAVYSEGAPRGDMVLVEQLRAG
ncbi:MAG: hypothetical protein HGA98_06465, partial [Deltaproteobacteria bacterium]|nr:hypothetical protein [Deltaproteobacteria bacterium]